MDGELAVSVPGSRRRCLGCRGGRSEPVRLKAKRWSGPSKRQNRLCPKLQITASANTFSLTKLRRKQNCWKCRSFYKQNRLAACRRGRFGGADSALAAAGRAAFAVRGRSRSRCAAFVRSRRGNDPPGGAVGRRNGGSFKRKPIADGAGKRAAFLGRNRHGAAFAGEAARLLRAGRKHDHAPALCGVGRGRRGTALRWH